MKIEVKKFVKIAKLVINIYFKENPDGLIKKFLEETRFLQAVEKYSPQLLEEVKGIAEGADVDFNTLFAIQCQDEFLWFKYVLDKPSSRACSTLGCFKEGNTPALLAQTLDWVNAFNGTNILLKIKYPETSLQAYIYTLTGEIALCGLNSSPLGICCNSLNLAINHSNEGLPVAFIVRGVLEKSNLEEAIQFLKEIKHATGQTYTIGDNEKIICLECSANKVSQYIPYPGARRVYHTNHVLASDDFINPPLNIDESGSTTQGRFNFLESQLKDPSKVITVDSIKEILSSHNGPVCAHQRDEPDTGRTLGTVIYSLTKPPVLYFANGIPCSNEFKKFKF